MMHYDELKILSGLASLVPKNGKILEIGSFYGRSTSALYAGKDPSVKLTVIDNWSYETKFIKNLQIQGDIDLYNTATNISIKNKTYRAGFEYCLSKILHAIEILQIDSRLFKEHKQYDLIFIDGDHDRPAYDIQNSIKNDKSLVFGDDFYPNEFPILRQVVQDAKKDRIVVLPRGHSCKLFGLIPITGYWRNNISKIFDIIENQ